MRGCIRFTVHDGFVPFTELQPPFAPSATSAPAPGAIATLRPGDELSGVYACTRKDRLTARSGSPYLTVELRDRTGAIAGRVFRDADLQAGRFDRGDLVRVTGRVERFRDELQVEVRAIARAAGEEADPAAFLPVAARRARATGITPTSAACSSTRLPSPRSRSRRARCTSASTRTCWSPRRSCTTSARRASSRWAPRSG
jgi:hypothetical protein